MIPIQHLESELSKSLGISLKILNLNTVGGGSINQTFQLQTTGGEFFLKMNSANRFPRMFEVESFGLELLQELSSFIIPKPVLNLEYGGQQFLVMDWLNFDGDQPNSYADFGRKLAELHSCSASSFGLDHNNYIGSLPQSNTAHSTWAEFLWEERFIPQLKLAEKSGLSSVLKDGFNRLEHALPNLFPAEKPSLIH